MTKKVTNITDKIKSEKEKKRLSISEIKKIAKKEYEKLKKISAKEPKDLVSGDMNKIIEGTDNA